MEQFAELVGEPLTELVTRNLPSCMVLVLSGYAQRNLDVVGCSSQGRMASTSHKLLISLLGKEVCVRTEQTCVCLGGCAEVGDGRVGG